MTSTYLFPVLIRRFVLALLLAALSGAAAAAATVTAATAQAQDNLYLPLVQRRLPIHPQAALLERVGQQGAQRLADDCGWEAGVLAWGWVKMWEASGNELYWDWTQAWVDGCLARGVSIQHVNDVPLAYAALAVNARRPDAVYLALATEAAGYLLERAPRTQDGTLIHLESMVWDDTLIDVIPFLTAMWRATGDSRYLDEAVLQGHSPAVHQQDPPGGRYNHAWAGPANPFYRPVVLGRGNGWVLLAQTELLTALPADDVRRAALLPPFARQAVALLNSQAPNGMWHTVITRNDFYMENSATALIAAALSLAAQRGLLDSALTAAAEQAVASAQDAVWSLVAADGVVGGVSGPTGPMDQEAAYNAIVIEDFNLYGQGIVLLMGAAALPAP